jgi:tetratricopeptide (TPR) repeat protein
VVEITAVPGAIAAEVRAAAHLAATGRLEEAAAAYQSLLARTPDLPDCWYELGLLQRRLRRYRAALDSYQQALRHGVSRPEEVHLNRAVVFADWLREEAAAERELGAALALNPAYLPALQNLANLHEDLGRREQALVVYERMLALEPNAFEALARYAQLQPVTADDPLIPRLRAALRHPAAGAAERASVGFALARRLDALGEYGAAFAAATAANGASRASAVPAVQYDRAAHERLIDALIAAFPKPRKRPALAAAGVTAPSVSGAAPRPIFICGMFRSGSTLTERALARHPQVAAGGELDLLPHLAQSALAPFPARMRGIGDAALDQLAAAYLHEVGGLFPGARYVTDKRPDNFLLIGLIKALFPEARIVHTTRDALDTCLSIFFLHLDQRLPWALDLLDTGHYFRQYQRLMDHWRSLYGADILDFSYDALVKDPQPAAQRLFGFCGLDFCESYLEFAASPGAVKTASVWQVREGLYRHASGRARHYARELAPLATYLAEPVREP